MTDDVDRWLSELIRLYEDDERLTDKQIKILQAAVEIFAEKGYASTSTSEIAHRAGVAEGTIFRHYATKKDLLFSIVTPVMSKLVAPFVFRDFNKVLHLEYSTYEEFVRAVIRNRIDFAQRYWPVLKVMVREISFQPQLQAQFKVEVGTQVAQRIRRVIQYFQRQGEIVEFPPESVMRLTASVVLGYLLTRFLWMSEKPWDDHKDVEEMVRFILHGLTP